VTNTDVLEYLLTLLPRSTQPGICWPADRWAARFPDHCDLIDTLPNPLDRGHVRNAVQGRLAVGDTEGAFLATMIWGYGRVGYGHFRTGQVLANPGSAAALKGALSSDPVVSYARLAGSHRLRGLGPAFGTKWLYFASGRDAR
jgi:hypothetical protein